MNKPNPRKDAFLKKKNKYNIPGYTDEELEAAKYDPEVIVRCCPICHHPVLDCHICLMCGWDSADGTTCRGERYFYLKMLEADPDYIWGVADPKDYENVKIALPQDEEIHIKHMIMQVFGKIPAELTAERTRLINYQFNKTDVSCEAEYVYRSDVMKLLKRLKEVVGDELVLVVKALVLCWWKYDDLVNFLKQNPNANSADLLKFFDCFDDFIKNQLDF